MGSVRMPQLNLELAREVTTKLYMDFFVHNAYAWLAALEVHFNRHLVEDRGQTSDVEWVIKIRRRVRDDASSPLEGGFGLECDDEWVPC